MRSGEPVVRARLTGERGIGDGLAQRTVRAGEGGTPLLRPSLRSRGVDAVTAVASRRLGHAVTTVALAGSATVAPARVAFVLSLRVRRAGFPRDRALAAQDLIAEKALTPENRAAALFWRSYLIAGTDPTPEERERALKDLAQAAELGDEDMKQRASGLRFKMTRLQVGMEVPDIEGEDLDGVSFRLSDYRGRVVLLSFWGDW